ncbi:glycosyltransferase [Phycisphaerales bacterium AB-hyl4]|uniref:Glycosyltransferase n=1 Tax=Natronomicrosphaera hydrolytica TaxID=3242702 RepID=A0ABV4U4U4_9BACT
MTMDKPTISFIIPAHNEQALLGEAIASIHEAAAALDEPYEVIVVDDDSTDATAAVAREQGAAVVSVQLRHIAAVRNAGAAAAAGDWLVFLDADTRLDRAVMEAFREARAAGAVAGGAVVRFDVDMPWGVRMGLGWWNLTSRVMRWAAGCFVFATREAFDAAGGFDERFYASEEIHLSGALKRQGRMVILSSPVTTSSRKFETWSLWSYIKLAMLSVLTFGYVLKKRDRLQQWYGRQREQ